MSRRGADESGVFGQQTNGKQLPEAICSRVCLPETMKAMTGKVASGSQERLTEAMDFLLMTKVPCNDVGSLKT
jgi:hypothetical protein